MALSNILLAKGLPRAYEGPERICDRVHGKNQKFDFPVPLKTNLTFPNEVNGVEEVNVESADPELLREEDKAMILHQINEAQEALNTSATRCPTCCQKTRVVVVPCSPRPSRTFPWSAQRTEGDLQGQETPEGDPPPSTSLEGANRLLETGCLDSSFRQPSVEAQRGD